MPDLTTPATDFQKWLREDKCYPVLEVIAKTVVERAHRVKLPPQALGLDDWSREPSSIRTVAEVLWEFLALAGTEKTASIAIAIRGSDMRGFREMILNLFLKHCDELRRKKENSPFHAYYRHLQEVLKAAEGVNHKAFTSYSYYAYSFDPLLPMFDTSRFWSVDYKQWPHPGFPGNEIHKKATMLAIARFFWDEAVERFQMQAFIPIRDLTCFVDAKYDLAVLAGVTVQDEPPGYGTETEAIPERAVPPLAHDFCGAHEKQHTSPDRIVDHIELERAAERLAASWKAKTREVFRLHYGDGLEMKDVATRLGFAGPSSVSSHKEKIVGTIREFSSQWHSGCGSLDATEMKIFFEALLSFCNYQT